MKSSLGGEGQLYKLYQTINFKVVCSYEIFSTNKWTVEMMTSESNNLAHS